MIDYAEGKALWANQENEPADWGDWADENAAGLIAEVEGLKASARALLDALGNRGCHYAHCVDRREIAGDEIKALEALL